LAGALPEIARGLRNDWPPIAKRVFPEDW
jgi:hypothetical protein